MGTKMKIDRGLACIPDEFELMGNTWVVVRNNTRLISEQAAGLCDYSRFELLIPTKEYGYHPPKVFSIFTHELAHALIYYIRFNSCNDHGIINPLSDALCQVFNTKVDSTVYLMDRRLIGKSWFDIAEEINKMPTLHPKLEDREVDMLARLIQQYIGTRSWYGK